MEIKKKYDYGNDYHKKHYERNKTVILLRRKKNRDRIKMLNKFKGLLTNEEWLNKIIDFEVLDGFINWEYKVDIYGMTIDSYKLVYKDFSLELSNSHKPDLLIKNKDIIDFYNLILQDFKDNKIHNMMELMVNDATNHN